MSKWYNYIHYNHLRRYGPVRYPFPYTVGPASASSTQLTIEIYPRRLRIYRVSPSDSSSPIYLSISRHSPLSQLTDKIDFGARSELYLTTVDRLWGDTSPLAGPDFWRNSTDRRLLLGANATSTQSQTSIAEALLENHDSLVAWSAQSSSNTSKLAEATAPPPPIFGQNNDYFRNLETNRPTAGSTLASTYNQSSTSSSTAITVKKEQSVTTSNRPSFYKVAKTKGTVGLSNMCVYRLL